MLHLDREGKWFFPSTTGTGTWCVGQEIRLGQSGRPGRVQMPRRSTSAECLNGPSFQFVIEDVCPLRDSRTAGGGGGICSKLSRSPCGVPSVMEGSVVDAP